MLNHKKIILTTLIVTLIVFSCFLFSANATIVMLEGKLSTGGTARTLTAQAHPSATAVISGVGTSFQPNQNGYLTQVNFMLKVTNDAVDGTLYCRLEYSSNNLTSGTPNGTIIAEATNTLDVLTLTTSFTEKTFSFNQTCYLQSNTYYTVYLYILGSTNNGVAGDITFDASANIADYTTLVYGNSAWAFSTTQDLYFIVYGDSASAATPTPIPTATVNPQITAVNNFTASLMTYMVPILALLLPVFGLYLFSGRKASPWVIILGLLIGASLGYLFMPTYVPIWLVFAVILGCSGFAWLSFRGGR